MLRKHTILVFGLFLIIAAVFYFSQGENNSDMRTDSSDLGSQINRSWHLTARPLELQNKSSYDRRLARLREECHHHQGKYNEGRVSLKKWMNIPMKNRPRIFVSDKYKVAVCNVPKCGSTQWRKLIVKLENNYKELTDPEFKRGWTERLLWKLHDISTRRGFEAAERKLNEYYRIMTVREPLERLVSAYKDKLEILKDNHFGPMSNELHLKYGNGSVGLATFSDFVDSILEKRSPEILNKHWKPFTDNCYPCHLNFDVIVKLETISQDFPYIAKKLHIRRNSAFSDESDALNKKWGTNYHDYYKSLSQEQRLKIFKYFMPQYDYFGYPYPDYL